MLIWKLIKLNRYAILCVTDIMLIFILLFYLTWAEIPSELFWLKSVVGLSIHLSVNFSHFHLLLKKHQASFNKSILEWKWFKLIQMKGHTFFQGEILIISFSRTTLLISSKLGSILKNSSVTCSNEGANLFPRGYYKNF